MAQNIVPFIIPLVASSIAGNASQDLQYNVASGQRLHVREWYWTSTGAFSLYDVRIQTNTRYTSANLTVPILSTMLRNPGNANLMLTAFSGELFVDPNNIFTLSVKDTSGSTNTINVTLNCLLELNAT